MVKLIDERQKYKNKITQKEQQKYCQLKNQVNREARKSKEDWFEQQCGKIDELFKVNKIKRAYHKIPQFVKKRKRNCTNIRDQNGQLLVDDGNVVKQQRDYLKNIKRGTAR